MPGILLDTGNETVEPKEIQSPLLWNFGLMDAPALGKTINTLLQIEICSKGRQRGSVKNKLEKYRDFEWGVGVRKSI